MVAWSYEEDVTQAIKSLRLDGFHIFAVEQAPDAIKLPGFSPPERLALVVGREVEGVEPEVIAACDGSIEIPMFGQKESFNVTQAAAMALYHCVFP